MLEYLIISIAINLVMFIPAYLLKTDKLTDLSYSLSFITLICAGFILNDFGIGRIILSCFVLLWAFRLGGFLFIRIHNWKRDKRFDGIREHFLKFLKFWILQGVSVWIILLSAILVFDKTIIFNNIAYAGAFIWLMGLLIESTADIQKYRYKQKGFITTGLWSISRHPNYFGEILIWIGIYVFCYSTLVGIEKLIGLVSPLYISFLLIFVTGLPPLEKRAEKKWGKDKKYQKYKEKTAKLIPWIW